MAPKFIEQVASVIALFIWAAGLDKDINRLTERVDERTRQFAHLRKRQRRRIAMWFRRQRLKSTKSRAAENERCEREAANQKTSFYNLPPELRMRIYEFCLPSGRAFNLDERKTSHKSRDHEDHHPDDRRGPSYPSFFLFHVSRTLQYEASMHICTSNTFSAKIRPFPDHMSWKTKAIDSVLESWLQSLPEFVLPNLKLLLVEEGVCVHYTAERPWKVVGEWRVLVSLGVLGLKANGDGEGGCERCRERFESDVEVVRRSQGWRRVESEWIRKVGIGQIGWKNVVSMLKVWQKGMREQQVRSAGM